MNNEAYGFSGCKFWLDAAWGLNTQTDGAGISKWIDKVGGYQYLQPTAGSQPLLVASDPDFNNLPSLNFYSGRRITSDRYASWGLGTTLAFIVKVVTINGGSNEVNLLLFNGIGHATDAIILAGGTGGPGSCGIAIGGWSAAPQLNSGVRDTNPHIVVMTFGVGTAEIVVDGVSQVTGSYNSVQGFVTVGSTAGGSLSALNSKVAEILIWNQKLSSADMISLSNRINSKYAIY
jgi:hypothetical protein